MPGEAAGGTSVTGLRHNYDAVYILDDNIPSERLFSKLGWVKANQFIKKGTGRQHAPRMWIKR